MTPEQLEEVISLGLRILPTIDKKSVLKDWPNTAPSEPEQIRELFAKHPTAQPAAIVPNDIIILDLDPRNGGSLEALETVTGPLPDTLTSWSGRGDGGRHLWFHKPAGEISTRQLPKGVDLRKPGVHYVIIPPALHNETGKPYAWNDVPFVAELPQQAVDALAPRKPSVTLPAPVSEHSGNLDGLVRSVAEAVEGERNQKLYWASCRAFDHGNDDIVQELFDAALSVGLTDSEASATIDSARRTDRQPVEPYRPNIPDPVRSTIYKSVNNAPGISESRNNEAELEDGLDDSDGLDGSNMGHMLNRLTAWFSRFIRTTSQDDIHLIALWCAHTYVVEQTYSTPRLQVDAIMRGSGKTTVLEHLNHLAHHPVQAAAISSPALLTRMVSKGIRTILIDEVDRSLNPNKPGVDDLIAILNSGYKQGATRPVLVPGKNGEWDVEEMPTYSPVAMAGNAPHLPEDTRSRSIRVLLMPDVEGTVEPSDWEDIEDDADQLRIELADAMHAGRNLVKQARPELPEGCIGRMREKWNPLARVAHVAGDKWPGIVAELITNDIQEAEMERQDGLANLPKSVQLIHDLSEIWQAENFIQTSQILSRLQTQFPHRWSTQSPTGKNLTAQGMGRMLSQMKIYSSKDEKDKRGYYRNQFDRVFRQFNLDPQNKPS